MPMSRMLCQSHARTSAYVSTPSPSSGQAPIWAGAVKPAMASSALVAVLGLLFLGTGYANSWYVEPLSYGPATPMVAATLWMGQARRMQRKADQVQLIKELAHVGPL